MPYHLTFAKAKEFMDGRRRGPERSKAKLENQTYLIRCNPDNPGGAEAFTVELFGKAILTFFSDGMIHMNDHGFFGWTTHDRYNKYLPSGFHVHGETIRAFGTGPFGFLRTPTGVKPYRSSAYLSEEGDMLCYRQGLKSASYLESPYNNYECRQVMYSIPEYAAALMKQLYSGTMERPTEARCHICEVGLSLQGEVAACHILGNVMCSEILETALVSQEPSHLAGDSLRVLWKDGYVRLHQKSRKHEDVADRMEYLVLYKDEGPLPDLDPRPYRPRFRKHVMEGLAEMIGCVRREWSRRGNR